MLVVREQSTHAVSILRLEGALRAPVNGELRGRVEAILRRGQRRLLIDLSRVEELDAAGVGELVDAYRMAISRNGDLRLVCPSPRALRLLDRAGLLGLLADDWMRRHASCA